MLFSTLISHLLFADDLLMMMRADKANANTIKSILHLYSASSGQKVNCAKSAIYFSPNTSDEVEGRVRAFSQIPTEAISDKYLGLPTLVGLSRTDTFQPLVNRVTARVRKDGMKKKLSVAGKEILIKAIAQAIPSYAMSCFLLPKKNCDDMMCNKSLMVGDTEERHMHWLAWHKMCVPKQDGGMGFRDLHSFNLAMLGKQCWRNITNPESLCARILKAKYFPNTNLMHVQKKEGSCFTWQSILAGRDTLKKRSFVEDR